MNVVVKVGTSSITDDSGAVAVDRVEHLCRELCAVIEYGHRVVLVSSGAIAAGLPALGMSSADRPRDTLTLQAVSAVGQARLMQVYRETLERLNGPLPGQVLISPTDFGDRRQYLHARDTIGRLLELGVMPVVNENDALADDEIRYGDNDRIAALVAQLCGAELLVLLTDAAGVFTADPRVDEHASLIEEIVAFDRELLAAAGGTGSNRGSGGMTTKLAAARIASWSGIRTVIAAADRHAVVTDAIAGAEGVGTVVPARRHRLTARKVWIAFGLGARGRVVVDDGAKRALVDRATSLLSVGVRSASGEFEAGDAVEVVGPDGEIFAKGLARCGAAALTVDQFNGVVVHRDDLVMVP